VTTTTEPARTLKATGVRYHDWSVRFAQFILDAQGNQEKLILDWGTHSCASWVCQMVEAITGEDVHKDFAGYTTAEGAAKAILKAGYKNLDELVADYFQEIPGAFVMAGDIVLVPAVLGESLLESTVMPNTMAVADPPFYRLVDPAGLAHGPLHLAKHFFAVGRKPACLPQ